MIFYSFRRGVSIFSTRTFKQKNNYDTDALQMNTVQSPRNPVTHWVGRTENPVTNNDDDGAYQCRRRGCEGEMISALEAAVPLANIQRNNSILKWLIHNLVAWSATNDIVGRWPWWRLINLIIIALSTLLPTNCCLTRMTSLFWRELHGESCIKVNYK